MGNRLNAIVRPIFLEGSVKPLICITVLLLRFLEISLIDAYRLTESFKIGICHFCREHN